MRKKKEQKQTKILNWIDIFYLFSLAQVNQL